MIEEAERNKNEDKEITIYLYIMPDDQRSTYILDVYVSKDFLKNRPALS
jgi:hypothetical protein